MSWKNLKKQKGFTLIELMIVVAIIGILAAVAIPKFADLVTKSKEASIKGQLGAVRSAISIYYGDSEGAYPTNVVLGLTYNAKYLPSAQGGDQNLGTINIPRHDNNTGHSWGRATAARVQQDDDGSGTACNTYALFYVNGTINEGHLFVNCSHVDTKGIGWSAY